MMHLAISALVTSIACVQTVLGHGHMYHPSPWHATNNCSPDESPFNCEYVPRVPKLWTEDRCIVNEEWGARCSFLAGKNAWFTNYTFIPGEATLEPEDMYDENYVKKNKDKMHPWSSPGSAPVFGDGCGANGGNPNGCDGMNDLFGTCCGACKPDCGCGGYVGGKAAKDHYKEGLFVGAATTTWTRGEPAEVYWNSGMGHRGGYAYRLCKVKAGKPWKASEKCFRKGHLNFHGNTTWIYEQPLPHGFNPENWIAQPKKTTTIGTSPKGSEWAKVNLPKEKPRDEYAIKDLVEVPESLTPGQYVLSFRWDSLRTPQVWSSCANINIV